MAKWIFICCAIVTVTLYQNCSATHESIEGASSSGSSTTIDDINMAMSAEIYERTLFPIQQEPDKCVTCHGSTQQPLHSLPDPVMAHEVIISFGLVNLRDPANSRMMEQLNNNHQGFGGDAARVMTALQDWADELVARGGISGVGDGVQPTFTSLNTEVFQAKCVGCHSPGNTGEVYDYTDYVSTINTGGITPLNAGGSLIMSYSEVGHELTDTAPAITPEERAALRDWINAGALNN